MDYIEDHKAPKPSIKPRKFCGQSKGYWSVEEAKNRGYTPGSMNVKRMLLLIAQEQTRLAALSERVWKQG